MSVPTPELKRLAEEAKRAREAWDAGRDGPNEHSLAVGADEATEALDAAAQPYENVLLHLIEENERLTAEIHLLDEVCARYADDEDAFLECGGEPFGGITTECGMKARSARSRFLTRQALGGQSHE